MLALEHHRFGRVCVQFLPSPLLPPASWAEQRGRDHHRSTPATPQVTGFYSLSSVFSLPASSVKIYSKRNTLPDSESSYSPNSKRIYYRKRRVATYTDSPSDRLIFLFAQQPLCWPPGPLIFIVLLFTAPAPAPSHSPKSSSLACDLVCRAPPWADHYNHPRRKDQLPPEQRGGNVFGNYQFIAILSITPVFWIEWYSRGRRKA